MSKKKNQLKKTSTFPQKEMANRTTNVSNNAAKSGNFLSFFKNNALSIVVLIFITSALYIQTVGFDYVLDDLIVIQNNKFTQQGISGIGDIFKYESFRGYFGEKKDLLEGDRYRPFSIATFAVEQSLFGGNKTISHFINVLLYALSGLLLLRVLQYMFPVKQENIPPSVISQFWNIPFLATILYMVHPLHTEVVANIKGRDEIIALIGELSALYFMFKYLNINKPKYLIYSFITFLIGILSKEGAITFLAIVPITAYFFTNATKSQIVKVTLPIIAGTCIYMFMRFNAIGYLLGSTVVTDLMNNPFADMNFANKMATIFYTLLIYIKLHIFPHPLTHDYYPYHIPKMTWADWQSILSLILHIGLAFVILRGWRSRSVWAYAAAFYLITLSIVSNLFVSVGTFMNERFVYHASLGFCIALAYFLIKKLSPTEGVMQKIAMSLAGLIIIGFSFKTYLRIPDWRNEISLNNSAIKNSPNSARANCFYGVALWKNSFLTLPKDVAPERKKAVLDAIKPYFDRAVQILPNYGSAQKMVAGVAGEYHKLDNNLDNLLKAFDGVNNSGTYEPFVLKYLQYLNTNVNNRADAEKLARFYTDMLDFYKKTQQNSILPAEYDKMLKEIQSKLPLLQQ